MTPHSTTPTCTMKSMDSFTRSHLLLTSLCESHMFTPPVVATDWPVDCPGWLQQLLSERESYWRLEELRRRQSERWTICSTSYTCPRTKHFWIQKLVKIVTWKNPIWPCSTRILLTMFKIQGHCKSGYSGGYSRPLNSPHWIKGQHRVTSFVLYRAVTHLRICGNLQQRGLPLRMAKPLRQKGLSADLVKTRKILTVW